MHILWSNLREIIGKQLTEVSPFLFSFKELQKHEIFMLIIITIQEIINMAEFTNIHAMKYVEQAAKTYSIFYLSIEWHGMYL